MAVDNGRSAATDAVMISMFGVLAGGQHGATSQS